VRSKETRFLRVARRLAEALGPDECLLAGGLAVMVHGFVRATRDVDLVTRLPLSEAKARLERGGLKTTLLRGDVFEGGFSCLKGECDGLPFDVLPQLVPIHWDAAAPVDALESSGLRAVALLDLLALKFKAQGAKDLMDAAMLVLMHPETEPDAKELATAYRVLDRLEHWLDDPRLHAQAREEARAEGLGQELAAKKPRKKSSRRPR
jgi:hypothetical protein